jgi:FAD dependent monooxygenase
LYDQLEDKSRIVLNKKVMRFEHGEGSVTVRCEDGSVFVGDLVVGADGVHSRTRKEMQRIANEKEPGLMDGDLESESSLIPMTLTKRSVEALTLPLSKFIWVGM